MMHGWSTMYAEASKDEVAVMLPEMTAVSPSVQDGDPLHVIETVSVVKGEPSQVAELASMDQVRADAAGRAVAAARRDGRMDCFMVVVDVVYCVEGK
jgi:hypothetical protein